MRKLALRAACAALALAAPSPPPGQDRAQERRSLGADSLFGPGIVDLSANGNAVKLRLTRPAHVVVFALRDTAVAQLVLPRRAETRLSRAGDQWVDLPWSVATGTGREAVRFSVGRVEIGRPGSSLPPSLPPAPLGAPGVVLVRAPTIVLVLVADSAWTREEIVALLPQAPPAGLMALAHNIATALLGPRTDTCAAYIVRW